MNSNYEDFMILLGNIFFVLVSGLLLSLAVVVLVYLLLRGIYPSYSPATLGFLVLLILFVILFFEGAFMTGAICAKAYVKDAKHFIETIYSKDEIKKISSDNCITDEVISEIKKQYPSLESYMSYFKDDNMNGNIISKIDSARRWFNRYIGKRIIAIVIISVIGGFLAGIFRRKYRHSYSNTDYEMYDG